MKLQTVKIILLFTGLKDWHVLSANKASCKSYTIYSGQI